MSCRHRSRVLRAPGEDYRCGPESAASSHALVANQPLDAPAVERCRLLVEPGGPLVRFRFSTTYGLVFDMAVRGLASRSLTGARSVFARLSGTPLGACCKFLERGHIYSR